LSGHSRSVNSVTLMDRICRVALTTAYDGMRPGAQCVKIMEFKEAARSQVRCR
jgi:hypothetical protein